MQRPEIPETPPPSPPQEPTVSSGRLKSQGGATAGIFSSSELRHEFWNDDSKKVKGYVCTEYRRRQPHNTKVPGSVSSIVFIRSRNTSARLSSPGFTLTLKSFVVASVLDSGVPFCCGDGGGVREAGFGERGGAARMSMMSGFVAGLGGEGVNVEGKARI